MNKKIVYTLDSLPLVVQEIKALLARYNVFTLTGSIGAGKTTLMRALLESCNIKQNIVSPTFTYVNIYKNDQSQTFYHFDCYRIAKVEDFVAAGFDEYLYQPNSWVFIEWPEAVMPLLDHGVCHITIEYVSDFDQRVIELKETG